MTIGSLNFCIWMSFAASIVVGCKFIKTAAGDVLVGHALKEKKYDSSWRFSENKNCRISAKLCEHITWSTADCIAKIEVLFVEYYARYYPAGANLDRCAIARLFSGRPTHTTEPKPPSSRKLKGRCECWSLNFVESTIIYGPIPPLPSSHSSFLPTMVGRPIVVCGSLFYVN